MNILVIHEVDWIKKVTFEPHHLAELLSVKGNNVYVIDCPEPDVTNLKKGLRKSVDENYNRIYKDASLTIIHPPSLRIKGLNRITHYITCKKIISETVREKKIDVMLLYGVATNGVQSIQVAKENHIPVVFRALDIAHGLVKIPLVRQLAQKNEKYVITNANKVLATTPDLARYAKEIGAKDERIDVFPLGINFGDFKPMEKNLQLAKSHGISEDENVILFMGTLYDFAGVKEIIMNFNLLKKNLGKIKFLIVGGGPDFGRLSSLVEEKNLGSDVILTGFVPQKEVPKYISLADLCINPFEINYVTNRILPTKILEYLACSKPVLSTPLRGTKEILQDEKFGIVYSESANFVQAIIDLIKNKSKLRDLGELGYEYTKKNHDWLILSEKLFQEFKRAREIA